MIEIAIVRTPFTNDSITINELSAKPLIVYRRWENAGLGVAIVPRSAISRHNAYNCIFKMINNIELQTTICLVTSPNSYISAMAKKFMEYISLLPID